MRLPLDCRDLPFAAYRGRKALSGLVAGAVLSAACGSGYSSPSAPSPAPAPAPSPAPGPPPSTATVTITNAGTSPVEVTVAVGGRVLFVNNDFFSHDIAGGPDPSRPDCLEINEAGFLAPGQSRMTAPLPTARMCDYHDHQHFPHVFGRIVIR